jgi:hypothetical protein
MWFCEAFDEEGEAAWPVRDPLSGNSEAANAAVIRARRMGARRTLIRPRLNFIAELLKSVENL